MPLEDHLPLQSRVFGVLLALAEGPLHGYALLKRLEQNADLGGRPGPTTLYRTLHELEDAGWVEPSEERQALDDERRRYFRLTRAGRAVLRAEVARLERVLAHARGTLPEARRS